MKEIEVKEAGKRIDIYLNELLDLSRTTIQKMCETGHIKVNNNTIKSSYKVKLGDIIIVETDSGIESAIVKKEAYLELEENLPVDLYSVVRKATKEDIE